MPSKPIMAVFVGDTHVGSNAGLCKPGFMLGGSDKKKQRRCPATLDQEKLYQAFGAMRQYIKAAAKGYRLFVMLGGDLVDGVNHHGTAETYGNRADQIAMAEDLLAPWVAMSEQTYGVTGTEAHVGHEGEDDRILYSKLCPERYQSKYNMVLDGKRLWWAHHGPKVGGKVWTKSSPFSSLATETHFKCLEKNIPKPDLIMGHDKHRSPPPAMAYGITVAVAPCWQGSTYYGDSNFAFDDTDLGVMVWVPKEGRLEYVPAEIGSD